MASQGIIKKLDEAVVNRIAAGEVIQRPVNALKEMIENSLDAQATCIQIVVKSGGIKLLQIQDNGAGMQKDDLEIVCERFTTSKLQKFEDLSKITTYGFRGEALSSISHVAHVTITTKTLNSKCAYKVSYADGKPLGTPKACAGNQGTQIIVEDLFYNMVVRKRALNSIQEEHAKITELVCYYAIHNSFVGFTLKKFGESNNDVHTQMNSSSLENIRALYGNHTARELLSLEYEDLKLNFKLKGLVSNANYSVKKCIFLLFINNRLVNSVAMRKAIELVYSAYLPRNSHPFLYISLDIAAQNVDVNVHPTKHEVHFLYEDAVLEKIQQAVDAKLIGSNASRAFLTQTVLSGAQYNPEIFNKNFHISIDSKEKSNSDNQLVRTDSKDQKLDVYFGSSNTEFNAVSVVAESKDKQSSLSELSSRRVIKLTSVLTLRKEVKELCNPGLLEIIKGHTFIGCVNHKYALFQYQTKLYLGNTNQLSEELFYQIMLKDFGNFGILRLSTPAAISDLVFLALDNEESGWSEEDGPKDKIAAYIMDFLKLKSEMLKDYFSIEIDVEGNICSLPLLMDHYVPPLEKLPLFVLHLATEVEWDSEKDCFETFSREMAKFYAYPEEDLINSSLQKSTSEKFCHTIPSWKWIVEYVLYPAMKLDFYPPHKYSEDTTVIQVANLSDLYKVFERC